jgi:hypothetical protein
VRLSAPAVRCQSVSQCGDALFFTHVFARGFVVLCQGMSCAWLAASAIVDNSDDDDDGDDDGDGQGRDERVRSYDGDKDDVTAQDDLDVAVVVPEHLVGSYGWAEPLPHPVAFDRNTNPLFRLVLVPSAGRVDFEPSVPQVEDALLATLENVAVHVSSFTSPEHQLMRLLRLPPRQLLPLRPLVAGDPQPVTTSDICASSFARLDAAR